MSISPPRQTRNISRPRRIGVPFAVEELTVIMAWSQARLINALIVLDHVVDGDEFEEVVLLTPCGKASPSLACWRDADAVMIGPLNRVPVAFWSVSDMLLALGATGEPREAGPLVPFMVAAGLVAKGYLRR